MRIPIIKVRSEDGFAHIVGEKQKRENKITEYEMAVCETGEYCYGAYFE